MRHDISAKHLSHIDRNLLSILCCFLIITVMWLGVYLNNGSMVLTGPMRKGISVASNGTIASQPTVMNDLKNQIKNDLRGKSHPATGNPSSINPVMQKVRSATSQTKFSFDNPTKRVEITGNAADGQIKENVAKIQGKAANSGREVENTIDSVMSNIKSKIN